MKRSKRKQLLREQNIEQLIEEEKKQFPNLWHDTYCITIKIPVSFELKKCGVDFLLIEECGSIEAVCDGADIWSPGLSTRIKSYFKK